MKRKRDTDIMITPKEAATFANYATQRDLSYCYELYHEYLKKEPFKANDLFYTMCVLLVCIMLVESKAFGRKEKVGRTRKAPAILPDARGAKVINF